MEHTCLPTCITNHQVAIRERYVRQWTCPICSLPDLADPDTAQQYLHLLGLLVGLFVCLVVCLFVCLFLCFFASLLVFLLNLVLPPLFKLFFTDTIFSLSHPERITVGLKHD